MIICLWGGLKVKEVASGVRGSILGVASANDISPNDAALRNGGRPIEKGVFRGSRKRRSLRARPDGNWRLWRNTKRYISAKIRR